MACAQRQITQAGLWTAAPRQGSMLTGSALLLRARLARGDAQLSLVPRELSKLEVGGLYDQLMRHGCQPPVDVFAQRCRLTAGGLADGASADRGGQPAP